ncbi:flagellar biosynthetic protein FliO [Herbaspirillum huttiense]|uniref:flagellar biosynthetic protein FliO n=1 Tax=Herbaspirillum huttiense TaxID=863372 RepID=UPI0004085BA3|nr:flagellar biosynthetic protein FliO [Herbaspirillum huttiense]
MNRPRRLRNFLTCIRCSIAVVPVALAAGAAHAAEQQTAPALPSATGSVFTMLLGLTAVLAIMAGIAWLFKRTGLVQRAQGNAVAKVVGGVSVGTRERVMVIEVADQWIVIGVAPGRVNTLATMPRQEHVAAPASAASANFSSWLKNTIDKRNGSS